MVQRLRAVSHSALILSFLLVAGAFAQNPTRQILLRRSHQIPVASLPCTADEAKWWADLREAATAVRENRTGKKERQKFLDLLQLGQEKSYQPPVPDMKPIILSKTEPAYSEQARSKRISGTVTMLAELRADGFVGDVQIVKGLGYGLDEKSAESARRTVFIPAVKDRKFITDQLPMENTYSIY